MHFSHVSLNHSMQRSMPFFTTSVHSILITAWQGVYIHITTMRRILNGHHKILHQVHKMWLNYFCNRGNPHKSTICVVLQSMSLTFTAHHGLFSVLLLCAVARSCMILIKGIVAILTQHFILYTLERCTHILCLSLKLYTVSLM